MPLYLVLCAHPSVKTDLIPGMKKGAIQWAVKTSSPSTTLSLLSWSLGGRSGTTSAISPS